MNVNNIMFTISVLGILYGFAHYNDAKVYVGSEQRSSGKVCRYLNTNIKISNQYFKEDDLGDGLFECPLLQYSSK